MWIRRPVRAKRRAALQARLREVVFPRRYARVPHGAIHIAMAAHHPVRPIAASDTPIQSR